MESLIGIVILFSTLAAINYVIGLIGTINSLQISLAHYEKIARLREEHIENLQKSHAEYIEILHKSNQNRDIIAKYLNNSFSPTLPPKVERLIKLAISSHSENEARNAAMEAVRILHKNLK